MRLKYLLILAFLISLPVGSLAATNTAATCSLDDVKAAYNVSADGDTVVIPTGSCTWSSTLTINKSVTVQGAGAGSTIITHNAGNNIPLFKITLPANKASQPVRISRIYFENAIYCPSCGANQYTIDIYVGGKAINFRIDNNTFHNGKEAITTYGWVNGVIDNNSFVDVDLSIRIADDADYSNSRPLTNAWGRQIKTGSSDSVFVEDNVFTTNDNNGCSNLNEYVYLHNGGRATVRYNAFKSTCSVIQDGMIDAHGLPGCDRGSVLLELYNNAFDMRRMSRWMYLRGGSMVIHDNTLTTISGAPNIMLSNEQAWPHPYSADATWPSRDQINNSFFWNNTVNGVAITDIIRNKPEDIPFIQKNRDYFMHAPAGIGGRAYYPGSAGGRDMIFSTSGANAYYPYSPYAYPHPLRSGQLMLSPPPNFRLTRNIS